MREATSARDRNRDRSGFAVAGLMATLLASPPSARADDVIVLSNKDNTLYESATGGLSNGLGDSMFVGRTNFGLLRRGVLSFDVAGSIPTGSTITSVSLVLQLTQTNIPTQTIDLHRLTGDWGEGTSIAP